MPELPEVQTTVDGLNRTVKGRKIVNVETSYNSPFYKHKPEVKNPKFFAIFKKKVLGTKILGAKRRAKNILINLSSKETIIVHMKMTGHFVYNRPDYPFCRLDFTLDNGKHLILSDMRKFAKVCLEETKNLENSIHLANLGPEPLEEGFKFKDFKIRLLKQPKGKIKQILMNPEIIAGIGNIYSDEILWRAGVHPISLVAKIPENNLKEMYKAMKETLKKGISLGGDSMSDYRNIEGKRGEFQEHHQAYRQTNKSCTKKGCKGKIARMMVGSRSAHFCPIHQKLYK